MLEVAMQMMSPEAAASQHISKVETAKEAGISAYETKNGRLMLGVFRPQQYLSFSNLLRELGHDLTALDEIQSWSDVWAISAETKAELAAIFGMRTTDQWVDILHGAGLPAEHVQTLSEAVDHPQLTERGYFQPNPSDPNVTLPTAAFKMSEGGPKLTLSPPRHGEHSRDVLDGLGFSDAEIQLLFAEGVVK
jgi:crotonobetainyl-CoA:carnitine CoA-transferase CaiB-like acyl-CoA transferase